MHQFLSLDLETTGLDVERDQILQDRLARAGRSRPRWAERAWDLYGETTRGH